MRLHHSFGFFSILWSTIFLSFAQVPEHENDPNGVAIPYPFVHLKHASDISQLGSTANMRAKNPYLLYQLGKDLVNRQYRIDEGAGTGAGILDIPLHGSQATNYVHGSLARFARSHANSCGGCHSVPFREPGGGQTIASTSGTGRNTPHFYGSGLMEMLGIQISQHIFNTYDKNQNGWIDKSEVADKSPVVVPTGAADVTIDFGDLSPGVDGIPRLNSSFTVWYLDRNGKMIADAISLDDPGVDGFNFRLEVFGWGRGYRSEQGKKIALGAEASTIREIFVKAANQHMGMQSYDPFQQSDGSAVGGIGKISLNGARQFDLNESIDEGKNNVNGISLDDPDNDGIVTEFTAGDLDAIEFYLLNTPKPALINTKQGLRGSNLFRKIGCEKCHVKDWNILKRDVKSGFRGDRRHFSLETTSKQHGSLQKIEAYIKDLTVLSQQYNLHPRFASANVEGIYTDFRQWDIGPNFYEIRFDGSVQKYHRTAPLWGVGSTAPYGHSGNYETLEEVIMAHGGDAMNEAKAFRSLSIEEKNLIVQYLKSLVLFHTEEVPSDINGDGIIESNFKLNSLYVGYERFDARFLFDPPPKYQVLIYSRDHEGRTKALMMMKNINEAYGLNLPYRSDDDSDRFPDISSYQSLTKNVEDEN